MANTKSNSVRMNRNEEDDAAIEIVKIKKSKKEGTLMNKNIVNKSKNGKISDTQAVYEETMADTAMAIAYKAAKEKEVEAVTLIAPAELGGKSITFAVTPKKKFVTPKVTLGDCVNIKALQVKAVENAKTDREQERAARLAAMTSSVKKEVEVVLGTAIVNRKTAEELCGEADFVWKNEVLANVSEHNKIRKDLFAAEKSLEEVSQDIKDTMFDLDRIVATLPELLKEIEYRKKYGTPAQKEEIPAMKNNFKAGLMLEFIVPLQEREVELKETVNTLSGKVKEVVKKIEDGQAEANRLYAEAENYMLAAYGSAPNYTKKLIVK
jgi:hypothetical protein